MTNQKRHDPILPPPAGEGVNSADPPGFGWLQVSCALFSDQREGTAYVPWATLHETLERWREQRLFRRCFFMHKSPGLRLRVWGEALEERLAPELVRWLDGLEQQNAIRSFRFAIYEPETFRFGGPNGMDIAHDHFDRDSRAALAYQTLADEERQTLPRELFSLLVTNDLFGRCVEDGAEMWDIWQRLRQVVQTVAPEPSSSGAEARARDSPGLANPETLLAGLQPRSAALLRAVYEDNQRIADRLSTASVMGGMTIGPRAWLAEACIFHWNRLALTADALAPLVEHALSALDDGANR